MSLLMILVMLFAGVGVKPVSAHTFDGSGEFVCNPLTGNFDGKWVINNPESAWTAKISKIDRVLVGAVKDTVIAKNGSVTGTESISGTSSGKITLKVELTWSDGYKKSISIDATIPSGGCSQPATASITLGTCSWDAVNGSQTGAAIYIDHAKLTINGTTYTTSTALNLKPGSYPYSWVANTGYSGSGSGTLVVGSCVPGFQLNLSHIKCVDGKVEVHFVLLNVPDGVTPGTLTYTYGSIAAGPHTGNVWHYTATLPDGTYNVTSASVMVGGEAVMLHNPGDYAGIYNCAPKPATASVTPGACAVDGSTKAVTVTVSHATVKGLPGGDITADTVLNLAPGTYTYSWVADAGYTGGESDKTLTVTECPSASVSVDKGSCSWSADGGSKTPVTVTVSHATVKGLPGGDITSTTTLDLAPGSYPYTWVADSGYKGSGSGTITVGDCTPEDGSVSIDKGSCSWSADGGSKTPVTVTVSHATVKGLPGGDITSTTTLDLAPGSYPYTWVADSGYKGSGSGTITVGDCTPEDGSVSIDKGSCSWSADGGSKTPVTVTVSHATVKGLPGGDITSTTTLDLAPGSYPYTWVADSGYKGSGSGTITVGDCTPEDGSVSIDKGSCSWSADGGSKTPVTVTVSHATVKGLPGGDITSTTTLDLAPGSYPYTWVADSGYKGSGSGTITVGDCTPGMADGIVELGKCTVVDGVSMGELTIHVDHAVLTLDGEKFTEDTIVTKPLGTYAYSWVATEGYQGSGGGIITIDKECKPTKHIEWKICGAKPCPGRFEWNHKTCVLDTYFGEDPWELCKEKNECHIPSGVQAKITCPKDLNMTILNRGVLLTTTPEVFDNETFNTLYLGGLVDKDGDGKPDLPRYDGGMILLDSEKANGVSIQEILANPDPYRYNRALLDKVDSCSIDVLGTHGGMISIEEGQSVYDAAVYVTEYIWGIAKKDLNYNSYVSSAHFQLVAAGIETRNEFGHYEYHDVPISVLVKPTFAK